MTTSRLFPATPGPAAVAPYSGDFLAGIAFKCLGPNVQWLTGYWWWVAAAGQSTAAQEFALWVETSTSDCQLISASVVTADAAFAAGQWNYVPLATPVPLASGTAYVAATGFDTTTGGGTGFSATNGQFGKGDPYASGLTSGNLFAYSDATGTAPNPTQNGSQGLFSVAGTDPTLICPGEESDGANFWIDVEVSDTAPAGYDGSYNLFPNNIVGNLSVTPDLNIAYNVGTEFRLSQACPVLAIRYLTPPGATQLATRAAIYQISGRGLTRSEIPPTVMASPSWSGAAGTGLWVQASYSSPPILQPGRYVVAVYNARADGTGPGWSAKDSITGAWETGDYANGIQNGPLSAPGQPAASTCYDYNGSDGRSTPPYSAGTTEPGQNVFGQLPSGGPGAPYLYSGGSQNYFVDVVVGQPVITSGVLSVIAGGL